MYSDLALYIDGKWMNGGGRKGEDVINPATEKPLAHLPHASKADLDEALEAANKGFALWRATSAYDRAKIMRKAADLMRERHDAIAKIMVQEQGKVYAEARVEVLTSADIIDWYAEEGRRSYGRIVPGRVTGTRQLVVSEPVGVVAAFTPWNFRCHACAQGRRRQAARSSSKHRKSTGRLSRWCAASLTPAFRRVLDLVFLPEAPSICWPRMPGARSAPPARSRRQARSGQGHEAHHRSSAAPVCRHPPTPIRKSRRHHRRLRIATPAAVCISPTRFYVQEDLYKSPARFTEYANGIKLGDGLEKGITMGPMANARRIEAMESFVADAKQRGGKVVTGGKRHSNQGYFYEPTVVTEVPDDSKVMTQEPFGPIAPIVTFKTFDEVVERANSLEYGLAAYAFTSSNATAAAIGDAMQSGMVGVNSIAISTPETPFGGVKESGHGSEGGIEGLGAYLNTKFISQG
jgi:succinate-semialdehyde dehydrogenase/glutarate-semialdehyde dehydrogenase